MHALKAGISLRGLPLNPPARKQKSPPYNARPWSRSPFMRACAGPEPGSNMPHSTRRVCRAAARGMQAETPPKQAALARQVRQRMNRLGKPEHRARFCFFSKKKSLAGMRRFPIPSKSKFGWTLAAAFSILATPKTLFQPPSLAGACATAPAGTTAAERLPCSPTSRRLRHNCPWKFALLRVQSRILGF